eukprot:snap_masked-scaffold_2-processed-gene-2.19-mRNA-1 protein AED:1.00 eAED:1.00 QI:0/-1/0/0/-1/1/1/0/255
MNPNVADIYLSPEHQTRYPDRPVIPRCHEPFTDNQILRSIKPADEEFEVPPEECIKAWRELEKKHGVTITQKNRGKRVVSEHSKYYIYFEKSRKRFAKCLYCGDETIKRTGGNTTEIRKHRDHCNRSGSTPSKMAKRTRFLQSIKEKTEFKYDLLEYSKYYMVKFDVPRVKKENVEIHVEEGHLFVSVIFELEEFDFEVSYLLRERNIGTKKRNLKLPEDCDFDQLSAKVSDGLLEVTIAKKEIQKPVRRIIQVF